MTGGTRFEPGSAIRLELSIFDNLGPISFYFMGYFDVLIRLLLLL